MIEIKQVTWAEEEINLRTLRQIVFIDEQQVPAELEWEVEDQSAYHWLITKDQSIIGCGRLLANGKIGRMAILKQHRQQGIGRQLLQTIMAFAKQHGFFELYLNAQTHAQRFYENEGFSSRGETFDEAGIPHITMSKQINRFATLGNHTGTLKVTDLQQEICNMAKQATRYIYIVMHELDIELFSNKEFLDILSQHARANRHTEIRLLAENVSPLIESNSPFISLAQRLNSSIKVKEYELKNKFKNNNLLMVDNDGIITQNTHDLTKMTANYYNKVSVKAMIEQFNHYWQFAQAPASIKQVTI